MTVNLIDIITQLPMPDISVKACHKLDTECVSPLFPDLVSDSSGRLTFTIQAGFDGYLESTSGGVMPFVYFFYPPLGTNGEASREVPAVPILNEAALAQFAKLASASVMPERGHVLARAYNCRPGETAVGLHFSSEEGDDATTPFYMIKGIPSTKHSATDGSGSGGLLNLPPGTATLTGRFDNDEAMGTISVLAKRGRITYTTLVPAPR